MVDECDRLLAILSEYQWKVKREVDMHEFFFSFFLVYILLAMFDLLLRNLILCPGLVCLSHA